MTIRDDVIVDVAPAPVAGSGLSTDATAATTDGDIQTVLQVRDLSTTFTATGHPVHVLQDVSFTVKRGETLILLGESGSGKSVTIRSILRLYAPTSARHGGQVLVDGIDVSHLDEPHLRRLRGATVSMIQQDPSTALDPLRRIGAQLDEALRIHRIADRKVAARAEGRRLLAAVGIADPDRVLRSFPHQISGGMRQRVAIALAISSRPRVILADEPTTALDVTIQAQVLDLLASLQRRHAMALVMITHDVGVAAELGGNVAVMYAGRIVESGPTHAVLSSPRHRYTQALLESLPRPGIPRGRLPVIPGRIPRAEERTGPGCAFAPRCPFATEVCRTVAPALAPDLPRGDPDGGGHHRFACHHPVDETLDPAQDAAR